MASLASRQLNCYISPMFTDSPLDLSELANRAGVSPRTIRYYIQEGLLPSPETKGPGAHYGQEHVDRLQIIKRLQQQYLPLVEIRRLLKEAGDDLSALLAEFRAPAQRPNSAKEYIRQAKGLREKGTRQHEHPLGDLGNHLAAREPTVDWKIKHRKRSQWERIDLGPDVELHIRRPLSREQNRQIDRLLQAVKEIFQEDAP